MFKRKAWSKRNTHAQYEGQSFFLNLELRTLKVACAS